MKKFLIVVLTLCSVFTVLFCGCDNRSDEQIILDTIFPIEYRDEIGKQCYRITELKNYDDSKVKYYKLELISPSSYYAQYGAYICHIDVINGEKVAKCVIIRG